MGDEDQQQPKMPIPNELEQEQEQEQVDSDFAFALALQEQERNNFTMLENECDGEDYDDYDEDDEVEEEDIQEMEAELEFSEGEDDSNGNYEELMEEDDIDPDELSYEDLIALGEIVGDENTGLSLEQISSCLRPISADSKMVVDRCVICQAEYEEGGERATLVALPSCEHTYHSDCISSWLQIKKTCPICGTEVVTKSNSC